MKVTGQGCGKQSNAGVEVKRKFPRLVLGDDSHEFVRQMAVGLKKGTCTDAVCRSFRLIGQMRGAGRDENLLCASLAIAGIRLTERHDASDFGERAVEFF